MKLLDTQKFSLLPSGDQEELHQHLSRQIEGEVRFDAGSRALYATDGSNYRQIPIGVVIPKSYDDVIRTIEACRRYGAPLLSRGGGTSLAGQCCNTAVVMDFSKYLNRILEINPQEKYAWVQPGVILDHLRSAAEEHHLTFGPDPSTHNHCTLGGMIGNNSCGVHSVYAGKTVENVIELDVVTYDGLRMRIGETSDEEYERIVAEGGRKAEIYRKLKELGSRYATLIHERYPDIPRRVSGYNLDELVPGSGFNLAKAVVGSEGTLVTILQAKVRLVESPPCRTLVVLGYESVYEAGDHIPEILAFKPIGLEGIDDRLVEDMKKTHIHPGSEELLPEGKGWLLVEFGGETKLESDARASAMIAALAAKPGGPSSKLYDDPEEEHTVWKVRESGLGATARVPGSPETWEGWEDSAVPPDKVGSYLRELRKLYDKFGYQCALYGHFGQGCIHTRIDFDLKSEPGITKFRKFLDEASDLVLKHGGSLSGEHGDGQSRAELLPKMFGEELMVAFREYKAIWDPTWKMNPGKIIDPYKITSNLRLGADYRPWNPKTHFKYPDDGGSFAQATTRCVGVGKCRRTGEGTMCPSYMVTREEAHATRGRAHLLFEMLQGEEIRDGWKDESVKEALDLCLACKGCKSECPVNVDMATYKAEFLSHYYEGRARPVTAYAFGWIYWWARLGSRVPGLVNFVTQTPILRDLTKFMGGIAPKRKIPKFAPRTFKDWYGNRETVNPGGPRVILWPDTFNNHFHPEVAIAATEALESLGFRVTIPKASLCCGRPLYDYGFLDLAKQLLAQILDELEDEISEGIPIIGLEPSCVSVFKDELPNLFPERPDAQRLKQQVFILSEFLEKRCREIPLPKLKDVKVLMHGHCHHKTVLGFDAERSLLSRMGVQGKLLDAGCCGMAGAFGYEAGKYEVSMRCGERVLFPAVRELDENTILVANGFSCHSQIVDGTGREPMHIAQFLNEALKADRRELETGEPVRISGLRRGLRRAPKKRAAEAAMEAGTMNRRSFDIAEVFETQLKQSGALPRGRLARAKHKGPIRLALISAVAALAGSFFLSFRSRKRREHEVRRAA